MKIDKQNGNVCFSEEEHVYWDKNDNSKYISVTTLIHNYEPEYDKYFWLRYKAIERLYPDTFNSIKKHLLSDKKINDKVIEAFSLDREAIEDMANVIAGEWEAKSKASCEYGTQIHLNKELALYKEGAVKSPYFGLSEDFVCKKDYYNLDLKDGIYPEYLIHCEIDGIKIAGQIDLLIKRGNDIFIGDYKTNETFKMTSYYNSYTRKNEGLLYPLGKIQNCHYGIYSLQLSLYAYMLQQINPEFNIVALQLIHIDREMKERIIPVDYLKNDVIKMIKHYKKDMLVKERKRKNTPIVY